VQQLSPHGIPLDDSRLVLWGSESLAVEVEAFSHVSHHRGLNGASREGLPPRFLELFESLTRLKQSVFYPGRLGTGEAVGGSEM
jgi:hypothetical protein